MKRFPPPAPGKKYVFRPWRWDHRKKRYVHASEYGLRAWRFEVDV